MEKRVVITGLGVIASNGIGREAFSEAIFAGVSGIKPISLFDTTSFKARTAGEISNFEPQKFLGPKGLRLLDRSTKLVCSAAYLALEDAALQISEENTSRTGVVMGDTLGSISSVIEFDKAAITEGAQYANPALFPNTVINSPSSHISIKFSIKGFNITVSTGFSSGLDAVGYAANLIKLGRAKAVLCGAVEEFCIQIFMGFHNTGLLAYAPELSCPFDRRRNGFILGEGAGVLVLEDLESALSRKAHIYAEVKGYCSAFNSPETAMRLSLERAEVSAENIDYISAAANSSRELDSLETSAVKEVFSGRAKSVPVSSVKSLLGECFSASGAFQLAAAVCALEKQMIHPTINYQEQDPACDLSYVTGEAQSCKINNVLINAFWPHCGSSSMVISKFAN